MLSCTPLEAHDVVRLVMKRCCAALQVQDTGIGIAEDKLQSIFVPFEQVSGVHRTVSVQQLMKSGQGQNAAGRLEQGSKQESVLLVTVASGVEMPCTCFGHTIQLCQMLSDVSTEPAGQC